MYLCTVNWYINVNQHFWVVVANMLLAVSVSLMIASGNNATCPAPGHKANLTSECNKGTQVCIAGVSLL